VKRVLRANSGDPGTLLGFLAARLGVDEDAARALLERGAIEVDGRRALVDGPLRPGGKVIAFLPDVSTPPAALVVAYEDAQVIVIDKPAGLRSQEVRGDTWNTLVARVQRELDPRAILLHRLDRDASGLVLFPRGESAHRALQAALDAGRIDRRYVARVRGTLTDARSIELPIARDPRDPRRRVTAPDGDAARSDVAPVMSTVDESVVRLVLHTGRTHQLRVHLAAIGHPILGDTLYGGPTAPRLCLHAYELTFPHPRSDTPRTLRAAIPAELVPAQRTAAELACKLDSGALVGS
jgi:RluA family pseudouridine synthase